MIPAALANQEFLRLSEFDGFHRLTDEAALDYIQAIREANTPEIARLVIDEIKLNPEREALPHSATIRDLMRRENERGRPDPALAQIEQWKREAAGLPPLDAAKLARHMELLAMRLEMGRESMPPEAAVEFDQLSRELAA